MDNINKENTNEIRDILSLEPLKGADWIRGKEEACRIFIVKKIADVGPIINDYISPLTQKLTPLTRGTIRYTTYERVMKAKLTTELECQIDEEEPYVEEIIKEVAAPIIVPPKKSKMPLILALSFGTIALAVIIYLLARPKEEPKIETKVVYKEVLKEAPIEDIVFAGNMFDSGKSTLKPEFGPSLNKVLEIMNKYPDLKFSIEGHTDNQGNEQENVKLSADRAKSIRDWLIGKGIDSTRLSFVGKGSSVPVGDNNTEEGRLANRRTEIKVVK
jgi:outer membrane protein OmpA-like peptidoglycan-associated protein